MTSKEPYPPLPKYNRNILARARVRASYELVKNHAEEYNQLMKKWIIKLKEG